MGKGGWFAAVRGLVGAVYGGFGTASNFFPRAGTGAARAAFLM